MTPERCLSILRDCGFHPPAFRVGDVMRALEASRMDGDSEDRMGGIFGTEHQQRQFRRSLVGQGWSEREVVDTFGPVLRDPVPLNGFELDDFDDWSPAGGA